MRTKMKHSAGKALSIAVSLTALALAVGLILSLGGCGGDGDSAATANDGVRTERISAWLVEWAKQRNFQVKTDDFKNVLISVPASKGYENYPTVVFQAHMDMVCQRTNDSTHDFSKDPIVLVRDGDWLRAKDTTLGADDGIGIAIALALAEDSKTPHPALELLITTDEEMDMTGAAGVSKDFLAGKKYINIDSEKEGVITLGSAGGVKIYNTLPLTFSALPKDLLVFSLRIDGLLGGHSGVDINKNRANANVLIAQAFSGNIPFRMINFSGGTVHNVITQASEMLFALSPEYVDALNTQLATFEQEIRKQYPDEKNLSITLTPVENSSHQTTSEADSAKVVQLVMSIPQGVYEWSDEFVGLPETSNNIGIVKTENNTVKIDALPRSFDPKKLEDIARSIEVTALDAGAASTPGSSYPAWPPNLDTDLYHKSLSVYERLFGTSMITEVVHAWLECGCIAEKYPGMEIVSIGPTVENVHTTREGLYVPSLEKVSQFLSELIQNL